MAFPIIIYDASGGSDGNGGTAAPATAKTNTTESQTISTATSTTQTFSAAVDLTGVADDDTDAIWIDTPAGERKLFRIVTFTGGVAACTAIVTTEAAVGTDGTLAWGIGGKRQTLEVDTSNRDTSDMSAGWTFEFGTGTYTHSGTLTPPNGDATDGPITFRAASGATRPVIRNSANDDAIDVPSNFRMIGPLKMDNSHVTKTAGDVLWWQNNSTSFFIHDVVFGDATNTVRYVAEANWYPSGIFSKCEFAFCTGNTMLLTQMASGRMEFYGCYWHDNVTADVALFASSVATASMVNFTHCIFDTEAAVNTIEITILANGGQVCITNCSFNHSNGGGGDLVSISGSAVATFGLLFADNICRGGVYIIDSANDLSVLGVEARNNAYQNQGIGQYNNLGADAGTDDVDLSGGDPYTDQENQDFSLNDTNNAGAACRAASSLGAFPDGNSTGYLDIGAVQHADPAGGTVVITGMNGGML